MRETGLNETGGRWKQVAQRSAIRLRFGAAFQAIAPAVAVGGIVFSGLCLFGRIYTRERLGTVLIIGALIFICAAWALFATAWRANKLSIATAFARLDRILGLNNALSVAATGRGPWPAVPTGADDLLRFNWKRILSPYGIWALLTTACLLVPFPGGTLAAREIPAPRSHETIAALIGELEKTEALIPEDIKQLQQRLDEIRNQPAENWYHHSSLEAADHLQTGIQDQLRALESGLNRAVSSIAALESLDGSMSSAGQQRLAEEFKSALQGLKNASPGLNQKLMESLSAIDPASLKSLNSDDLHKMLEKLKEAANGCKNCQGPGRGGSNRGDGGARNELESLLGSGEHFNQGPQNGGDQPGRASVQRGPGVAALPLSRNPTDLGTEKPEFLQSEDFRRARPGDALGSSDTEHNLDRNPVDPQAGGGAAPGQGGKPVSRDVLLPEEKTVLRAYFR